MKIKGFIIALLGIFSVSTWAELDDTFLPGHYFSHLPASAESYTILPYSYHQVSQSSRQEIQKLLSQLQTQDSQQILQQAAQFFMDRPYIFDGAEGEGDWCDLTKRGCAHIQQDPIYRTDQFNCQTLVQTLLALLHAKTINQYEKNILSIAYGAADEPSTSIHFYNRNNFASVDFNPINEKNGLLQDVTQSGIFKNHTHDSIAMIDRQSWFALQQKPENLSDSVRVIASKEGPLMAKRFSNHYPNEFHVFPTIKSTLSYIPKEFLVKKITHGNQITYEPNTDIINQIPTPAVVEIVRDTKKWRIHNIYIKDYIGSEFNISHMGFLYRQQFKPKETIYQKITCASNTKACSVTPVLCEKPKGCTEVMFLHATDGYPSDFYYYKNSTGHFVCTPTKPQNISATTCNRVLALPLGDYLSTYQYGKYLYMTRPSILGIHLEKIN